ncbi:hypothetical protein V9T40_000121 [Parthenolecanium corni]|uniref:Glycosyl hydrolase family 13 catalytic domain-containing protein n=1 Tax=Parthenolecanium corni TaxID=536013 RepID=A0AAN9TGA6_9HEMI
MTKFWLEKGVSGICLKPPEVYMEDPQLRHEEIAHWIHNIVLISGDRTSLKYTMKYYGKENYNVVHFPLNFLLTSVTPFPSSKILYNLIKDWFRKIPARGIANWQAENHYDVERIGSRLNAEYMDIMMILVMTLPGVVSIYYGQEIGMMNTKLRPDQIRDTRWHDSGRSPMQEKFQWGCSSNSKFWLPVNSDYYKMNVETQKKQRYSRYKLCSILSSYRRTNTLKDGNFKPYLISPWIFAFTSYNDGKKSIILVIINTGSESEMLHLHTSIPHLPPYLKVIAASMNAGYERGTKIYTNPKFLQSFIMRPSSALVLVK